jgi:alkanesulfonate monooxygenase
MPLRFHWSMSSAGEKFRGAKTRASQSGMPHLEDYLSLCRNAEHCGIDSLLTAFGFHRPDPLAMASALGVLTDEIKFMVAVRSGVSSPTALVQQVNTVSALTNGRVCINIVMGHTPDEQQSYGDFLSHDERYERTDEFLTVCNAFWRQKGEVDFEGKYYRIKNARLNTPFVSPDRKCPEIFLGGNSSLAEDLAIKHADCLWRLPESPERIRPSASRVTGQGTEVGLLVSLIVRPTGEQARAAACSLVESLGSGPRKTHEEFAKRSDSVAFTSTLKMAEESESEWLTPYLWTGAVPFLGAPAIALVGSPEDITRALMEYRQVGISQFLFMGWPDIEEMNHFKEWVLPLLRKEEAKIPRPDDGVPSLDTAGTMTKPAL